MKLTYHSNEQSLKGKYKYQSKRARARRTCIRKKVPLENSELLNFSKVFFIVFFFHLTANFLIFTALWLIQLYWEYCK